MFTAKELKEIVNAIPDDTPIILQGDDDGNWYRYMRGLEFIAKGKDSNFYNEKTEQCYRKSDLKSEGLDPKKDDFVLCAVAY